MLADISTRGIAPVDFATAWNSRTRYFGRPITRTGRMAQTKQGRYRRHTEGDRGRRGHAPITKGISPILPGKRREVLQDVWIPRATTIGPTGALLAHLRHILAARGKNPHVAKDLQCPPRNIGSSSFLRRPGPSRPPLPLYIGGIFASSPSDGARPRVDERPKYRIGPHRDSRPSISPWVGIRRFDIPANPIRGPGGIQKWNSGNADGPPWALIFLVSTFVHQDSG